VCFFCVILNLFNPLFLFFIRSYYVVLKQRIMSAIDMVETQSFRELTPNSYKMTLKPNVNKTFIQF
jgi:hypothetical protein